LLPRGFSLTAGPVSELTKKTPPAFADGELFPSAIVSTPHQTSANCLFHEIRMVKGVVKYTAFAFAVGTQGKPNNCEICGYPNFSTTGLNGSYVSKTLRKEVKTTKKTKSIERQVEGQGGDRGCQGGKNLGRVSNET
jgi:hypothetical protein